ncbi:MAG: FHA domain-containing protein [Nannocystaceae bacterium]
MALLRAREPGLEAVPPARCLIGRSRACDLVLHERNVSSQHAVLEWIDGRWEIQDLHSRNGTHVDEVRLASGARAILRVGARLRFGRDAPSWELCDASAPELMARSLASDALVRAEGGCLTLPDAQEPECSIYQDARGGWRVDQGDEVATIEDREVVHASGGPWRIHLPTAVIGTMQEIDAGPVVAGLSLRFAVSRDEEYVELTARTGDRVLDLQARAHHYPLLLLARRRLADVESGLGIDEQGWIRQDELLRMLRVDDNHLNISIHRARAQLGKAGVLDAASLVERRTGTRQLRLGVSAVEIVLVDRAL